MIISEKYKNKLIKFFKVSSIVLVGIAGLLYVLPYFFKDTITKSVNELAKDFVKSDVRFEKINLSFYTHFPNLTVNLENSKIGASSNFPNQDLIKASDIALGIDLFSLFGDKITFNQLYLSNAIINVKSDSLGNANYDVFISDDEAPKDDSTVNLNFENIIIKNTQLVFEDKKNKIEFRAQNLNYKGLVAFVNNNINLNAKADIAEVFFAFDKQIYIDKKALKGNFDTQINLDKLSLTFNKNQFVLAKFPFEINGKIDLPENEIDFDLQIVSKQNQLQDLLSVVPPAFQQWYENTQIEGTSSIDFSLKGKMNSDLNQNPNLKLNVAIANGSLNYKQSPNPIKNINLVTEMLLPELNPDKMELAISKFNFNLMDGFAKGNLNFKAPATIQSKIETKIDLAKLQQASGLNAFDVRGILDIQANVDGTYATEIKKVGIRNVEQTYIASVPKMNVNAKWSNGYFKMKDLPLPIEGIFADLQIVNTDGDFKNTAISVNQLKAKAANNFIDGFVKVENLHNYKMHTNIKADLNLADITSIYPVESFVVKGDLAIDFKADGTYEPKKNIFPVSNSYVKLDKGFLKYTDIPELPIEDIDIEMKVSSSKGSMNDLKVEVLPISFKLAGEPFKLDADLYNFNNLTYKINSKGTLDLSKIYRIFAVQGYNVNGLIKADLNIFGKGTSSDKSTVSNRGFIDLQDIYLDSEMFPNSFIIQKGKLKFQREKILLDNVNATYGSNAFKIGGNISNYMNFALNDKAVLLGDVTIQSPKVNVDEFMVFDTKASASSQAKTSATATGVILIPENFKINVNAKANQVLFEGLVLSDFKGDLNIDKGIVKLNDTNFGLIGSTFSMNGAYQPISTKMAKFDYSIRANDFDIQKAYKEITIFRDLASAAESVFGLVSLDYTLSGVLDANMMPKLKTIKGQGVLTLEDIQFKGFKLFNAVSKETSFESLHDAKASKVEVKTSIENNVMTIEPTKFKMAGFRPRIQGQVTLDGRMNLGFRLGLPPFGIIGIPMTITGNSENMKIKLGKQKEEPLEESDEEYENYKKSLEPKEVTNIN
ncbi:AsmA-like C-terminal region-containing protein [Flavobacterium sp. I3-2]|uniref:AsmA-like C-terminal region-containing protein n=1 Tax=Flavobacterium sp. I3-2 TaxID=2748319 RepID=UPI0015B207DE|nr:AsmA-like C-terminal region-containing protein [Flavobacterium sp. I3-2]